MKVFSGAQHKFSAFVQIVFPSKKRRSCFSWKSGRHIGIEKPYVFGCFEVKQLNRGCLAKYDSSVRLSSDIFNQGGNNFFFLLARLASGVQLKMLWENIADISFVRDYRRKKKQPRRRRAETDEECIEEMFSHVGMEEEDDGYHVV